MTGLSGEHVTFDSIDRNACSKRIFIWNISVVGFAALSDKWCLSFN